MPMKRLFAALICALPVLLCSCSEEEDTLPEQRNRIVSYLQTQHIPALVPISEVEEGSQQGFYTTSGSTVYRYVTNFYRPGRSNRPKVTAGSRVVISMRAYVFDYKNISDNTLPIFTNDTTMRKIYEAQNLWMPESWTFQPITIDMRGDILKGLHDALLGCHEEDEVEAYMTYNMAFGYKNFSTIPRESPIAWFFTVGDIE